MSTVQDTEKLKQLIINTLENLKAINITVISVAHLTTITDYMIICTGTSVRQVKALANNVITATKLAGFSAKSEGEQEGEWMLVDSGDVVAHIMLPKTRDFYNLEGLWQIDEKT